MKRTRDLGEGFTDAEQAALYDLLHPPGERNDFRFYLPLIMEAESVLDVGCGTGALLHMAREAGHSGRLAVLTWLMDRPARQLACASPSAVTW